MTEQLFSSSLLMNSSTVARTQAAYRYAQAADIRAKRIVSTRHDNSWSASSRLATHLWCFVQPRMRAMRGSESNSVIASCAVEVAIGINRYDQRQVVAVVWRTGTRCPMPPDSTAARTSSWTSSTGCRGAPTPTARSISHPSRQFNTSIDGKTTVPAYID